MEFSQITDEVVFHSLSQKEIDEWFLMSSPWPVLSILAFYLLFAIKLGPDLMKKRNAFNIKPIILIYNLHQTIFNAYLVSFLFTTEGAMIYIWNHGCHKMDPAINSFAGTVYHASWLYFISKVMDLLDTIFFIMRKKESHVTFLHVYHHANMVLSSWAYLKYIKDEQGVIFGALNSFVHVIMYGYYFLSALGPEMRKYLWWKKYITRIQLLQFIIITIYMGALLAKKCKVSPSLSIFVIFQGVTFFFLFANFYIRTYRVQLKPKTPCIRRDSFGQIVDGKED